MLKPFMRLFGIDDDVEPIDTPRGRADQLGLRDATPGPQIEAANGRLIGAQRQRRDADARQQDAASADSGS